MSNDFNGARNLLEFKDNSKPEPTVAQRSNSLYQVKDYENLVNACKELKERIPSFHPKLVVYNNGSLRNWINTIWAVGSYFKYKFHYNVCIIGDIQYFSHFMKSGEITQSKVVIPGGKEVNVYKTSADVTLISFAELRSLRAKCGTIQEFEELYENLSKYFQMVIVGMKSRVSSLKREDFYKVIFLNSNSIAYTLQMEKSTHAGFNSVREFFKKFDLKESGVFLE